MKFDEIRAEGRIRPEVALHAYEKTGIKPSYNWWQCGIAVVAAACEVRNSEVFGVIGEPYKTGYIDGFDGRTKNVWELGILSRLRPGNGDRYCAGFEDGVTLRKSLKAGLGATDLDTASLDEELAELRAEEPASV
ncbi:MAG: hypothetical protein M3R38_05855 [Actinomycetota bacterium]|nr:hypothetical protein [Actinomycetota bacterium]